MRNPFPQRSPAPAILRRPADSSPARAPARLRHLATIALAALSALLLLTLAPTDARADDAGDRIRALPGPMRPEDLHAVAQALEGAIVKVRVREDLGAHYRPRYIEHTVHATWVAFPRDPAEDTREEEQADAPTHEVLLMSPWAPLARAVRIEVEHEGRWIEVAHHHATPFFDLASLHAPEIIAPAPEDALRIAAHWPRNPVVHTITPPTEIVSSGRLPPIREGNPLLPGNLHSAALPPEPAGIEEFYFVSPVAVANGWPLVDDRSRLVALTSTHSTAEEGQVLAIPFAALREWYTTRPRLQEHGPTLAPAPEVRRQRSPVRTGPDAFGAPPPTRHRR